MGQFLGTLLPLRFRLWLGRKLYSPLPSCVVRVGPGRVIKGPCGPQEVEAMQYIAQHTSIPIPRVYAIHKWNQNIYIEMEFVRGLDLNMALRTEGYLSSDQKKAIFADIKEYISILRELKPPKSDLVSSALQNPTYDLRVGARFFGPFGHSEFHSLLRQQIPLDKISPLGPLSPELDEVHTASYRTHFTHADLVPRNIIVRDGRVAAIIDWGFAGWYPEYWEFTKAHYGAVLQDWLENIPQILPGYDVELAAERKLWEMIPDPGTPATYYREEHVFKTPGSRPSQTWLDNRDLRQPEDLWSIVLSSDRYNELYNCP